MDFEGFLEDIMKLGKRPDGYSIDRKNNDGNYELKNVRWASRVVQNRNTRRNYKIARIKNGKKQKIYQCIVQAEEEGFSASAISQTINGKHKTHKGFEWVRI